MTTQNMNSNPFEIIDGQVILHDVFQGVDKTILNYEQVGAIKLLLEALKNGEILDYQGHGQAEGSHG